MNLRSVQLLLNRGPLRQKSSFVLHRRKPRRLGTARVWFRFRANNDCTFIFASATPLATVFMPLGRKAFVVLSSSSTESKWNNCEKESNCSRPVSNWGPFACQANVITTTLRKPAARVGSDLSIARFLERESNYRLHCALQSAITFYF